MYWTDWGTQQKIERAKLDGSNRQALISTSLHFPNGLALAVPEGLMFWTDAGLDKIEVANMDGSNRKTLLVVIGHVFSIDLYGKSLISMVSQWISMVSH